MEPAEWVDLYSWCLKTVEFTKQYSDDVIISIIWLTPKTKIM